MTTAPLDKTTPIAKLRLSHNTVFWIGFCVVMALLIVAPLVLPVFWRRFLTEVLIWGLLAMSSDLLIGYTGMVSFGHSAFFFLLREGLSRFVTAYYLIPVGVIFILMVIFVPQGLLGFLRRGLNS